jgi:uncharacterized protein (DUF58 family)
MSWQERFPGFRLRLTRWGGVFLIALLVLGLAAVNTGNNSLMAILGLALGTYAVSGGWSRQVLGAIRVTAAPAPDVYAGRATVVDVEVVNTSRWLPAYGVVVRDGRGRIVVMEELLAPRGRRVHAVETVFERRGRQPLGPWRVEIALPLGFFLKSKAVVEDVRVLVYPRLLASGVPPERSDGRRYAMTHPAGRGREGDVTQLRDWREGDDPRQLHWKQTARQQRPIVADRQHHVDAPVIVVLDTRLEDPDDGVQLERFEHLVSLAATTVVERLSRGMSVGLVAGPVRVAPVAGASQAGRLLAVLAEVTPQDPATATPPPAVRGVMRTIRVALGRTA